MEYEVSALVVKFARPAWAAALASLSPIGRRDFAAPLGRPPASGGAAPSLADLHGRLSDDAIK